jgi:hypothetical protein
LETYRQRWCDIVPIVDTGATQIDVVGGAREVKRDRIDESSAAASNGAHTRIANCECGAQLAGGTQAELFEAVQRHVAHHHPQLLGALELDLVNQMAENVEGH